MTLAQPGVSEETNENGEVEHVDREPLWVTWSPRDSESGISKSTVCVSLAQSTDCLATEEVDGSAPSSVTLLGLPFLVISGSSNRTLYKVTVRVVNGAGLHSAVVTSKPFLVLRRSVAGSVTDGRGVNDADYSYDKSSVAVRFSGFSSDSCGIVGYEWGIGTSPYATDVLPYTARGLVVDDQGEGFAQAHVMQTEGQKYYSTVRARVGQGCAEEFVVASSDGFVLDVTPPRVTYRDTAGPISSHSVVYQADPRSLGVLWHAEDLSGLKETWLVRDVYSAAPEKLDVPGVLTDPLDLASASQPGDSLSSSLTSYDLAGNEAKSLLPLVTFDTSPPVLQDIQCTKAVSALSSMVTCEWQTIQEDQSPLTDITVGLGSGPSASDLLNMTNLPVYRNRWEVDVSEVLPPHRSQFFVIIRVENAAGLKTEVPVKVSIDVTAPALESVSVVTSSEPGFHDVEQRCQTSQDYIEVLLRGFDEPESEIAR